MCESRRLKQVLRWCKEKNDHISPTRMWNGDEMAEKHLWNDGWQFREMELTEEAYQLPGDEGFVPVDIPHDWLIYDTFNLYRDSIGWYCKDFVMEDLSENGLSENLYFLRFDGVYMDSTIFVNGREAFEWKYGYSTFEADITSYLKNGNNRIMVRVVHQSPNSRWYSGAGIYRNIWWKVKPRAHLVSDGVYITPIKRENDWLVEIDTELAIPDGDSFALEQTILDEEGREAGSRRIPAEKAASDVTISMGIPVKDPLLWDIEAGNLYTLRTRLWQGEVLLETEEQRFGFRTFSFTADKGFFINGRNVRLNGVCEHHDFGCLGAAFYKEAMRRKFRILRSMGVNAVRTSHNMPAPELMELADEMGFLILSEAFDMWEMAKTPYDYARFFPEWCEKDVASWVRRDRNHPSLLMWSIGNEIVDTHVNEHGQEITCRLRDAVRRSDPKRHAPVTIGSNYMKWENAQKCADLIDIAGYNYAEYLYEEHHAANPERILYGSETSSVVSSRGIYHFPQSTIVLTDEDMQCSALGNSIAAWGAKSHEACICDDRDAEFSQGQFIWTGFDYFGESTPYQTRNSYFGQIDTAGFPKDSFYVFQAAWTDHRKAPMIHIFPYWDFNEGQLIDVQVCTNAPRMELLVNGESRGYHETDHLKGRNNTGIWKIPYEKGVIEAIAYDRQGKEIARDVRYSFGDGVAIKALPDKEWLRADGQDLIFLEISLEDGQGHPVENARNRIQVDVTGAARLIGLDNGDSTDFDQVKGKSRRLFGGKLLAVLGSKTEPGEILVTLTSPGLVKKQIILHSGEVIEAIKGVSAYMENDDRSLCAGGPEHPLPAMGMQEIPVRKIELKAANERVLTKENDTLEVEAILYPSNTTYQELKWQALTDTGIEVKYAAIEAKGNKALVKAVGDGDFRLRCSTLNGGSCISVESSLEITARGMGVEAFCPYEELTAGLCDYRSGRVSDGIEHGMSFLGTEKDQEAVFGFTQVDFGEDGSDTITLLVFANTLDPVTIDIWEGRPGDEGSVHLGCFSYLKPLKWMVFQEETYHLSKRLTGVTSLYFSSPDGFHIRGFYFEKQSKAYIRLCAGEYTRIYGDSYELTENRVERIGNNVTLEFDNMDFGPEGADRLTIYSRSELKQNPVQLRFTKEEGSSIQVIEAAGSPEYGEQSFVIEPLKGRGKIEFIFLPGSKFDLWWFQFDRGRELQ